MGPEEMAPPWYYILYRMLELGFPGPSPSKVMLSKSSLKLEWSTVRPRKFIGRGVCCYDWVIVGTVVLSGWSSVMLN
jgi:hypothetical protein